MEKTRVEAGSASIHKIEFGSEDNYIVISVTDAKMFDNFASGFKRIIELSDEATNKIIEIAQEGSETANADADETNIDRAVAKCKVNVQFSEEAVRITESIFGKDVLKKYFADIYRELPDFLPDADCILDFYEKISPVMENLFSQKLKARADYRKKQMAKYKPRNYKPRSNK